jgi:hypothetical protein
MTRSQIAREDQHNGDGGGGEEALTGVQSIDACKCNEDG